MWDVHNHHRLKEVKRSISQQLNAYIGYCSSDLHILNGGAWCIHTEEGDTNSRIQLGYTPEGKLIDLLYTVKQPL